MSSLVDVVIFNPVGAGASDFVVSAARLGYLTPAAAGAVNGATYSYRAESADLAQWEVGRGVWNAGSDTLTRAVVLYNSLGNTAKINFTLVPQVGLVALATDVAALDGIAHYTNTTEATGVGTTYAARFEGGVEFAKKVFITGGVGVGGALNVAGVSSAAGLSSSSYVRAADGAPIGWGALSATIVGNSSADIFVFYTASTERMRVTNTQISISPTTASSSTTTGALIVGGGVGVGGALNVAGVSNLRGNVGIGANVAPDSLLTVNANTALPVTLVNPGTHFVGADAMFHFLTIDTFGGNAGMQGRRANGTLAAKTAVTAGTVLLQNSGAGWNGAAYTGGAVTFVIVAAETFTNTSGVATANGAYARINTTPIGSTTSTEAVRFQPSGGVSIGATAIATDPGIGSLNITNNLSVGAMKCVHPTGGLGYGTGAGGTVTQATNRTTGVTLNKSSGAITLFSQVNTAISQATAQSFTVTNSAVDATDTIIVSQKSGTDKYEIFVTNVAAGSFQITNYAVAGTTNEAPVFNFTVIKGVTS